MNVKEKEDFRNKHFSIPIDAAKEVCEFTWRELSEISLIVLATKYANKPFPNGNLVAMVCDELTDRAKKYGLEIE